MPSAARIERTLRALDELPAWFVATGLLAGVAVAVVVVVARDRRGSVVLLAGCGVLGLGAAAPDTEVVAVVSAGLLAVGALGALTGRPRSGGAAVVAGVVAGASVALALWDGARGRPAVALLALVVVAPVALASPDRRPLPQAARAVAASAVAVVVARLTGLGDGLVAPGVGGAVGAALVLALAAAVRPGDRAG